MPCSVVCISGADGAGAQPVGRAVADALGFRLIDEGIVAQAAAEAGVDPQVVADAERRTTVVARLLEELSTSGTAASYSLAGFFVPDPEASTPSADALRSLIRSVVEETAARGDVVIVAHAASHALAGREGALRVLVTAPAESRRRRLCEERGLDDAAGRKLQEDSDAGRARYLKRFYGVGSELPTHYDLVLNTDRLGTDVAAGLVVQAARS
jgi:cytidylate kinase